MLPSPPRVHNQDKFGMSSSGFRMESRDISSNDWIDFVFQFTFTDIMLLKALGCDLLNANWTFMEWTRPNWVANKLYAVADAKVATGSSSGSVVCARVENRATLYRLGRLTDSNYLKIVCLTGEAVQWLYEEVIVPKGWTSILVHVVRNVYTWFFSSVECTDE